MQNIRIKQIYNLLHNKANLFYDEKNATLIIRALEPTSTYISGFFLEYIDCLQFANIDIPNTIQIELIGWLINTDSNDGDLKLLQFLKKKYNIIDNCIRGKYDKVL